MNDIGIPTENQFQKAPGIPSKDRLQKGPVVVVECFQEIPCNVCEIACPYNAIKVGRPLTSLPIIDENKCLGCGSCIPICPGLAIFVVDLNYSEKSATVSVPYEFLPLPELGDKVYAVNRRGTVVCEARVMKVMRLERFDRTHVVTINVPKEHVMDVRFLRLME